MDRKNIISNKTKCIKIKIEERSKMQIKYLNLTDTSQNYPINRVKCTRTYVLNEKKWKGSSPCDLLKFLLGSNK